MTPSTAISRTLRTVRRAGLALLLAGGGAQAALDVGDKAPPFAIEASLAGNSFRFSLAEALKKGPVVLYFFPAAFSIGCTIEAHQFAEAHDQYQALGATVIGVSADDIDTLKKFSTTECRNKFAVGADADKSVMKAYDAVLAFKPDYSNRTSYVIAPDGKIIYQFTSLNPYRHVSNTLGALKTWVAAQATAQK
ncbi:MAG: peroxiredoxin [Burkholderiaceae bacterium]|nr:peroxiredoxin [Burkholderiaceae bacterium]